MLNHALMKTPAAHHEDRGSIRTAWHRIPFSLIQQKKMKKSLRKQAAPGKKAHHVRGGPRKRG